MLILLLLLLIILLFLIILPLPITWALLLLPVSVEKALLRRRIHIGLLAFRTPNQGLESSLCWKTAWQRLQQKGILFSQKLAWFRVVVPSTPKLGVRLHPIFYWSTAHRVSPSQETTNIDSEGFGSPWPSAWANGQSSCQDSGFQRAWPKHNLDFKGFEFSCPQGISRKICVHDS